MKDFDFKSQDLNDFFSLIGEAKKEKKEKMEELVSNSFEDYFWKQLQSEEIVKPKPKKRKKLKKDSSEVSLIGRGETSTTSTISQVNESLENTLIEKSLGLLSEPSNVKQQNDSLTPLDKNFVTFDQLQNHYREFISRVQQQLSTLGGGGESNLTYIDVPVTYVTSPTYSITHKDYYIGVNYAGAVTITLPKADREGKIFIVKDELGEASKGTNRYITVLPSNSDLIDGRDRAILAFDYGSLTFIWRGSSWRVV